MLRPEPAERLIFSQAIEAVVTHALRGELPLVTHVSTKGAERIYRIRWEA